MPAKKTTVIAVLGKGGAGKTVFSALAARALIDLEAGPILLVDADPSGGLAFAVGADSKRTVGAIREALLLAVGDPETNRSNLADKLDWMTLEALQELTGFSLLAMGCSQERGCYCRLNSLLREALGKLASGFAYVILDAEAGIEQVNRQVFDSLDLPLVVTDGSMRGLQTARQLSNLLSRYGLAESAGLVLNRAERLPGPPPELLTFWGRVPQDELVYQFDHAGKSLLDIPANSPALASIRTMIGERLRLS